MGDIFSYIPEIGTVRTPQFAPPEVNPDISSMVSSAQTFITNISLDPLGSQDFKFDGGQLQNR